MWCCRSKINITPPCLTLQGPRSHKLVILAAAFVLMTLLILFGSNNVAEEPYAPFHVATNYGLRTTNLKKWGGRDGYLPVTGNKVCGTLLNSFLTVNLEFRRRRRTKCTP